MGVLHTDARSKRRDWHLFAGQVLSREPVTQLTSSSGAGRKYHIHTFGCQAWPDLLYMLSSPKMHVTMA